MSMTWQWHVAVTAPPATAPPPPFSELKINQHFIALPFPSLYSAPLPLFLFWHKKQSFSASTFFCLSSATAGSISLFCANVSASNFAWISIHYVILRWRCWDNFLVLYSFVSSLFWATNKVLLVLFSIFLSFGCLMYNSCHSGVSFPGTHICCC